MGWLQRRRMLDTQRAEKEFGFRAVVGLEEGLRQTIEWYRNHSNSSIDSNRFAFQETK